MRNVRALYSKLRRTAASSYPKRNVKDAVNRTKFVVRALLFRRETEVWFELLKDPRIALLAERDPFVFSKLQRPYLHRKLPVAEKVKILCAHYQFASTQLPDAVFMGLASLRRYSLVKIPLEDTVLEVLLSAGTFTKEGECAVVFRNQTTGESIFTLSFTVIRWDEEVRELYVGGLQGHRFGDEKAKTVSITRGMFGMRPKALVLFVLQQIAICWGANSLRCVSDDMHIYRSWQKRRALKAEYDSFWEESGGVRAGDGLFDLPVTPLVRDIASLKPNKRSMYRQRYAMLDTIAAHISAALSGAGTQVNHTGNESELK
ncbi:MAG: DUF535 family protein [Verrucomicrobiota bacterium]